MPRKRSTEAADLGSPKYRQRVVPSKVNAVDRDAVIVCSKCHEDIRDNTCGCDAAWETDADAT